MPKNTHNLSSVLAICEEVDRQLNTSPHTLRSSNAYHRATVNVRSVIAAAKKINVNARKAGLTFPDYIALAIEATLLCNKPLSIAALSTVAIRKKIYHRSLATTTKRRYVAPSSFPTMNPALPPEEILGAMIAARTELDPAILLEIDAVRQGLREGLISIDHFPTSVLQKLHKKSLDN